LDTWSGVARHTMRAFHKRFVAILKEAILLFSRALGVTVGSLEAASL